MKKLVVFLFALVLIVGPITYWACFKPVPLGESDFLLVGEVANHTVDADFDDSLREAIRVSLLQSPYLNLVSDERIHAVLMSLGKPSEVPLTPELSKGICGHVGAKAYLTGNATKEESTYRFELAVHECLSGRRMAQASGEAAHADQ